MIQDFVVEIFVPKAGTNGKSGGIGTGYPITRDRILTARHVVFPEDFERDPEHPIEFRLRCEGHHQDWRPIKGIAWEDTGWDLALLEYGTIDGLDVWEHCLSDERPMANSDWFSVGFSRAGGKRDGDRRPYPVDGRVKPTMPKEPRFQLAELSGPDQAEDWQGASGSPVFIGTSILGVITAVPDQQNPKRLDATPLWRVLRESAAFRTRAGYRGADQRASRIKRDLAELLAKDPVAVDAMVAAVPGLSDQVHGWTLSQRAEAVIAQAFSSTLDGYLKLVDGVYRGLRSSAPGAAAVVAQLTRRCLPALYDSGVVEQLCLARKDVDAALVTLPAYHATVAELAMAGADKREAQFRPRRNDDDFPKGKFCLPEPPETGFTDKDGQRAMEALETHLLGKFAPGLEIDRILGAIDDFLMHRFASRDKDDPRRTAEQRCRIAASIIDRKAEIGETHYLVFRCTQEGAANYIKSVARKVRARYPGLMCIELSTAFEHELAEIDRFPPLLQMIPKQPRGR